MVTVLVTDEQSDHAVDTRRWAELARRALEAEGVASEAELSLAFVDEATMAGLNHRYAGEEGPTDVLAFPIDDVMIGDVVICPAVAARNAATHGGSDDAELALLVVHGVLHLLGMDHADEGEAREMQRRERQLLDRFHTSTVARSST